MTFTTTFQVRQGRTRFRSVAFLSVIFSPALLYGALRVYQAVALAGQAALLAVVALVLSSMYALVNRREEKGEVTIDPEGVRLGTFSIPRRDVATASFVPESTVRSAHVQIRGLHEELGWIGVKNRQQADEVLRGLGMPTRDTTATFAALSPMGSRTGNVFLIGTILSIVLWWFASTEREFHLGWLMLIPFFVARAYWLRARLVIGADGFFHAMRLAPRFVAWKDVERIDEHPRGVAFVLRSREVVMVPLMRAVGIGDASEDRATCDAALARARDALETFRSGEIPDVSAHIARRGRTTEEWVAALHDREGTFRRTTSAGGSVARRRERRRGDVGPRGGSSSPGLGGDAGGACAPPHRGGDLRRAAAACGPRTRREWRGRDGSARRRGCVRRAEGRRQAGTAAMIHLERTKWVLTRNRMGLWTVMDIGTEVSVFADAIRFGDHVVPRAQIDLVYADPPASTEQVSGRMRHPKVWMVARGGELVGRFDTDEETAARAMSLLSLGGARVTADISAGAPAIVLRWVNWAMAFALLGAIAFLVARWGPLVIAALLWAGRRDARRYTIEATASGMTFTSRWTERLHLRWDEIAEVEALPFGFFVRPTSGGSLSFHDVRGIRGTSAYDRKSLLMFLERAASLKRAAGGGDQTAARERAAVALVSSSDGKGFREGAVPRQDLWLVVEDGKASPVLRARAARELAHEASTEERARFRVASEWCGSASLRAELEQLGGVERLDEREVDAGR